MAVPQGGWHRRAANRSLPPGSLSKPVAVEVAGAARDDRQTVLVNQRLKIWLWFPSRFPGGGFGLRARRRGGCGLRHVGRRVWVCAPCRGPDGSGERQVPVCHGHRGRSATYTCCPTSSGGSCNGSSTGKAGAIDCYDGFVDASSYLGSCGEGKASTSASASPRRWKASRAWIPGL